MCSPLMSNTLTDLCGDVNYSVIFVHSKRNVCGEGMMPFLLRVSGNDGALCVSGSRTCCYFVAGRLWDPMLMPVVNACLTIVCNRVQCL